MVKTKQNVTNLVDYGIMCFHKMNHSKTEKPLLKKIQQCLQCLKQTQWSYQSLFCCYSNGYKNDNIKYSIQILGDTAEVFFMQM